MPTRRLVVLALIGVATFLSSPALRGSPAVADELQKVEICHFPPGKPANFQTITIGANALAAHLKHGDFPGACANDCRLFGSVCDDQNPSTTDTCNPDGTCKNSVPTNCDDGNPCTRESLNPETGECDILPNTGPSCDDGDPCTITDTCTNGRCAGTPRACCSSAADCNDEASCTVDTCNADRTCSHVSNCDDNSACTVDMCDSVDGCLHVPVLCEDYDACTDDGCDSKNGCFNVPIDCDDDDPATIDTCDSVRGCLHEPR